VTTVPITLKFFKGQIGVLKKLFNVIHGVEMKRDISIINDIKSLVNLFFFFKKSKPHIVHGNTPKGGLLSMSAAYLARVPKRIYCIHGLRYDLNYFSPKLFDARALRKENKIGEVDFVYGFVGRLVGDKGVNELIEAFVTVSKKNTNAKLLLVGGYEEELDPLSESTIDTIKNNQSIISVGFQKDIRPYLAMMDVFTFPSYREGFGVSIMEAGAMGVPAISSDISGCNEIVKDGYNGKLIKSKSLIDLENSMRFFIENQEKVREMSEVSRDYIANKYSQETIWKAIESYYNNLS